MKIKYQVFVSCTDQDLSLERQATLDTILNAGHIPAGMGLLTINSQSQWQTVTDWIDDSDIYIVLLGNEYGNIEPKSGLSYNELEFDYAVKQQKPILTIAISEDASTKRKNSSNKKNKNSVAKLKAFREKVLKHNSHFFSDTKELRLTLYAELAHLTNRKNLAGWQSQQGQPNIDNLIKKIDQLIKDNNQLTKENEKFYKQILAEEEKPQNINEIIDCLNEEKIKIPQEIFSADWPSSLSLLLCCFAFMDRLTRGVKYQMGSKYKASNFIYLSICAPLVIYKIMESKSVNSSNHEVIHYELTPLGKEIMLEIRKLQLKNKNEKKEK